MSTWLGTPELLVAPGANISDDGKGITTALVISGPYADCLAKPPRKGQTLNGYPGRVIFTRVTRAEGGGGTIDVTLRAERNEDSSAPQKLSTAYSVQMATDVLELETHARYAKGEGGFGATLETEITWKKADIQGEDMRKVFTLVFGDEVKEITATVGATIQRIKTASVEEKVLLIEHSNDTGNAGALLKDFFKKYNAGLRSYSVSYPVLRRVSEWFGKVPDYNGKTQYIATGETSDFGDIRPAGNWQYLKIDDSLDREGLRGRIRRVEQYKGALEWDKDIYPAA